MIPQAASTIIPLTLMMSAAKAWSPVSRQWPLPRVVERILSLAQGDRLLIAVIVVDDGFELAQVVRVTSR
jgi:hypothetical protein